MYKLRLGCSVSIFREDAEARLLEMKENGFDSFDVDLCANWHERDVEIEAMKHFKERIEMARKAGIPINAVHISFGHHWDFASYIPSKRQEALDNLKEILPLLDELGALCYIIHGSFEPIADEHRKEELNALHDSLIQITSWTKTPIAVESLPRTCLFNTAKEGISIIDSVENVYACLDVNHFLFEKTEDAIMAVGSRIITTHISDHDYVNERHWLPGNGSIDWNKVIGAFEAVGYSGVFNYEVGESPSVLKENYEMLFRNYNESKKA